MKRRDEVAVGILITVAVVVLVVGTLWLVRGGLRSGYPLFTRFAWGQSLKQGQPVLLAGVSVGYVADVALKRDGFLDVEMRIHDQYQVPVNAVAEVTAIGIFGDAAVALKVNRPAATSFKARDTVPSRLSTGGLDALTAQADTITESLARITKTVEQELVHAGGIRDVRQTAAALNRLIDQMQLVVAAQNANMTQTLTAIRGAARAVDSAQVAATLESFRTTSANADSLMLRLSSNTTQLQAILARMERGEGTVGKMMADSSLYRDARELLMRVDSLVADFQRNPRKYINLRIF